MFVRQAQRASVHLGFCLLALVAACPTAIAASANSAERAQDTTEHQANAAIAQAKAAFEKGRIPELERIIAKNKNHLLAAWPDYWRLKLLLGIPATEPAEMRRHVSEFLKRHSDHPLAETAQRDWLQSLVRKELWADAAGVLTQLDPRITGPNISCARAKAGLPPESIATPANRMALPVGQESLDACIGLIEDLAEKEQVSSGYLRQRLRWAAQSSSEPGFNKMSEIFRRYAKAHDLGARGPDPLKTELQLSQILRTARLDSLSSLENFRRQQKSLTHEQHDYASFAVGAALWRRSHSSAWPMMVDGWKSLAHQPDSNLQNAAREAIRRHAWPQLMEILSAMSASAQAEPAWQYWRAIALQETGSADLGREILAKLRDDFGFYGLLAKERTGAPMRLPAPSKIQLSAADRAALDRDAGIQRSYALLRAGLRAEAVQEWSAAMRNRTDTELIHAALHARDAGFFDRAIAAADRTREQHDFHLRFPTPFKNAVLPAAKELAVDPWWVLGLIRQESRFIPDIKSSVGASGLMQIMPATGAMLAKNIGIKPTRPLNLTDVDLNIRLGTTYMRQLQDRFGGSALLASAAYNAGPSRAVSWRAALPKKVDGAAFAESIPFPETRDYVKRVLSNAVVYHALHNGGAVPSLRQLLGDVSPAEQAGQALTLR